MYYLIYRSKEANQLSPYKLSKLVEKSRNNNYLNELTGILIHQHGSFMQMIEGKRGAVEKLYQLVESDNRHHSIELLSDGEIDTRTFPHLSMAFCNLDFHSRAIQEKELIKNFDSQKKDAHDYICNFYTSHLPLLFSWGP